MAGLIVALDTADATRAAAWARAVASPGRLMKIGLEFYLSQGADGVRALGLGPVFLDLKLHDIPNTVAGAVRAVIPLRPALLTVHAAGGPAMLARARTELEAAGPDRPRLLAVTVLTSLDAETLHAIGVAGGPRQQVLRLARLAMAAGADGLVCGPHEISPLRDALGGGPLLVVPGIRPRGAEADDQARVMTPREAAAAGADWIVVGRPITAAPDPAAAAAAIAAELA